MKISKYFDKKENKEKFKARFQLNNKEFAPKADTRKRLNEIIDEIRAREHRINYDLPVQEVPPPLVSEVFEKHKARLVKEGARKKISIFDRVSEKLLKLLPAHLKITDLKKAHFQRYIDARLTEKNAQSEKHILPETVNKELSAIAVAIRSVPLFYPELENLPPVVIPRAKTSNRRRERTVDVSSELAVLLEYLRRPHRNSKFAHARAEVADDLEIRYQTGLRRKEVSRLEKRQYIRSEGALRNIKRWKTDTITKFFPLSQRAIEIIESRLDSGSKFIFSENGNPRESTYRMLKEACKKLGLNYGAYNDGAFVPSDLRHNFATEIIQVTDIETAKSLTGHTGTHLLTYLHTDERRQREAVNKRQGMDLKTPLTELYNGVKDDNIALPEFIEKVVFLIKNN